MNAFFIVLGVLALLGLVFAIYMLLALARCGKAQDESRDDV